MNRFVIFGYYGRGNLGDETNLREIVSLIRNNDSQAKITVISAAPAETAAKFQVNAIAKYDIFNIYFSLRKADTLIGGGGSLFQDRTSLRSLFYYSSLILLAKLARLRIFLYGQGIGPLHSWVGRLLAGWVLSMTNLITVRDRLSIIALAELNIRKPEIYITAEPLLILNQISEAAVKSYWNSFPSAKQLKVGLIIQEYGFLKRKFWRQLITCLSWDQSIELYLILVDQQDLVFLKELASSSEIKLLSTQKEWEELQKAVGGLDLVISTRLHGLVAAVIQKITCFGVAVDPKIEGFCLQLGVPFLRPTMKTEWLTLGNRLLNYLSQPLNEQKPWESQILFWKARAMENQLILKKFITQ